MWVSALFLPLYAGRPTLTSLSFGFYATKWWLVSTPLFSLTGNVGQEQQALIPEPLTLVGLLLEILLEGTCWGLILTTLWPPWPDMTSSFESCLSYTSTFCNKWISVYVFVCLYSYFAPSISVFCVHGFRLVVVGGEKWPHLRSHLVTNAKYK